MSVILLTLAIGLANIVVDVETVDGESYRGELTSWSDDALELAIDDHHQSLNVDRLHHIRSHQGDDPVMSPKVLVELHDGSLIAATDVQTEDGNVVIQTATAAFTSPLRAIRTVRWRRGDADLDASWKEIVQNEYDGDAIVVRRDSDTLDFLEGTVESISDAGISFRFDQQVVDVPRHRLAGVVLFRPAGDTPSPGRFRIDLRGQNRWQGNHIAMSHGEIRVRTVSGVELTAPMSDLLEVAFATQSMIYLSDLKPDQTTVEPFVRPSIASDAVVQLLYRPLMNQGFAARPLRLQFTGEAEPRTYPKGMALHSKTRLVYRLEEPFRGLRGVIGWDPDFGAIGGSVQVQILAGGEPIFDGTWNPEDPPVEIDVPIQEARRLELIVDYGDGSDVGDRINLCNLRLMK